MKLTLEIEDCAYCFHKDEFDSNMVSIKASESQFYVSCSMCGATGPLIDDLAEVALDWNEVSLMRQNVYADIKS